jgi:altronate dehydratase
MTHLYDIARLPDPTDNCAIAIRDLEAGTSVSFKDTTFTLSHTVLVGHRFAVELIKPGDILRSWAQRFGIALRDIQPGEYVMNSAVQVELSRRNLDFELPKDPNFENKIVPYEFDESSFTPALPLPLYEDMRTFEGYAREGGRGVGTRNMIVLLGTSSLVAGFTRTLAQAVGDMADAFDHVDGIVPISHTEGGHNNPNNHELLLRTMTGFMVHPNVGAVIALDYGNEAITNTDLQTYSADHGYALDQVLHQFYSLSNSYENNVAYVKELLTEWLPQVNGYSRSPQPLSKLKIALQCGGSDAFSGVSGNPLAAWVAKEVIRYGGSSNLAETDELIGAESYVLDKVETIETARKFLTTVERFKAWVGWHGQTAEGNPSGGNKYRGLYNIYLKSLGAAAKRHPDVPLHAVIDYSQPMTDAGFYFMDSPGNDLESIAGQVASGCNLIFFVTGNGSITNFPFVPTIKIVTTTERYNLLESDMDVNAGAYLDGTPLDQVGAETLDMTVAVASGQRSVGEEAGHSQVQIWRDWEQTKPASVTLFENKAYDGQPIAIERDVTVPHVEIPAYVVNGVTTTEKIGLIMPTSLCSGQIARMTADTLNTNKVGSAQGLSRFVTLVHTEGCGGTTVQEFKDTLIGYLQHPKVQHALLLEHGCEITHNSYLRTLMSERDIDPNQFGWASIQSDGGIEAVKLKIAHWFTDTLGSEVAPKPVTTGLEVVRIGLMTNGEISNEVATELATLTKQIVAGGGTVIISAKDRLIDSAYMDGLGRSRRQEPSLAYGQRVTQAGFHVMQSPRQHWTETLSGLGATGIEAALAHVDGAPLAGHPLVPVLQVTTGAAQTADLDGVYRDTAGLHAPLLDLIVDTLSHRYIPKHQQIQNVDFQITRGLTGVSF